MKTVLVTIATGLLLTAGPAAAAPDADFGSPASDAIAAKGKGKGHVHKAWPQKKDGRKPNTKLARRIAKQVGPVKVKGKKRRGAGMTGLRAMRSPVATRTAPGVVDTTGEGRKLLLVRSFDIPKDDKLYADLANYSWTYDNALATIAFVADKDRSQARQLLDQLKLLQNKDGSFNFAFDVATGASSQVVRSGAVAWVGLAGTAFADKYGDKSYDSVVAGAIDYLLSQRNSAGLITGGSGVSWASTQHNLLAAELLRQAERLSKGSHRFGSYTSASLAAARSTLNAAIAKHLYVQDGLTLGHFRQGQDDNRIPVDVQALGAMYLQSIGDVRALAVNNYILRRPGFYVGPRSTPVAQNPVSGMRPFLDPGSPDLIWSEGTIESQMAVTRLGNDKTFLKDAVESLEETIKPDTVGPIGADRQSDTTWGQYQTWPTSAAASWLLMNDLEDDVYLFQD